jgi:hypothetical protein
MVNVFVELERLTFVLRKIRQFVTRKLWNVDKIRRWSVTPASFEAFAADAPASTIKSIRHENSDRWRRRP